MLLQEQQVVLLLRLQQSEPGHRRGMDDHQVILLLLRRRRKRCLLHDLRHAIGSPSSSSISSSPELGPGELKGWHASMWVRRWASAAWISPVILARRLDDNCLNHEATEPAIVTTDDSHGCELWSDGGRRVSKVGFWSVPVRLYISRVGGTANV